MVGAVDLMAINKAVVVKLMLGILQIIYEVYKSPFWNCVAEDVVVLSAENVRIHNSQESTYEKNRSKPLLNVH